MTLPTKPFEMGKPGKKVSARGQGLKRRNNVSVDANQTQPPTVNQKGAGQTKMTPEQPMKMRPYYTKESHLQLTSEIKVMPKRQIMIVSTLGYWEEWRLLMNLFPL